MTTSRYIVPRYRVYAAAICPPLKVRCSMNMTPLSISTCAVSDLLALAARYTVPTY